MPNSSERFMRRAIALSAKGFPAPNPHVGCVIVKEGVIIGEGYHHFAGGPHAEVNALENVKSAEGADVYVTLEPCNHFGRTPPCTQKLIQAKVRRVYVAVPDPNPVATGGSEALKEAGIEVQVGLLQAEAEQVNVQFLTSMRRKTPYVVVKIAASLDGRIALPSGESQWLTGTRARAAGRRLRAECGAVLVGRKTVQIDNPRLTARVRGVVNPPVRIILDPNNRLSGTEHVFDSQAPTHHITGPIQLHAFLSGLFSDGIAGILVEGGAHTIASFVQADLVDRFEIFVAPKLLGAGRSWLEKIGIGQLSEAPVLEIVSVKRVGPDVRISAVPRKKSKP
jgi:diaminohydroxyphosphoribosylaminopyrimidine deaminase / 5-amino-6-(5-phosphoribosylamino)uracil reductase